MKRINIFSRIKLYLNGFGVSENKNYIVVYNRKTGEIVYWRLKNGKITPTSLFWYLKLLRQVN